MPTEKALMLETCLFWTAMQLEPLCPWKQI